MAPRTASRRRGTAAIALLLLAVLAACGRDEPELAVRVSGGDPAHAPELMRSYGCISCHVIPGVTGANGKVGPPLAGFARRVYIAGALPNTPEHLVTWIANPQAVEPGTAMPDMGVTDAEARHMAAYLYTLDE